MVPPHFRLRYPARRIHNQQLYIYPIFTTYRNDVPLSTVTGIYEGEHVRSSLVSATDTMITHHLTPRVILTRLSAASMSFRMSNITLWAGTRPNDGSTEFDELVRDQMESADALEDDFPVPQDVSMEEDNSDRRSENAPLIGEHCPCLGDLGRSPLASTSSIPSELSQSDRTVSTRSSQIQLPAHRIAPRRVWIVSSTSSRTLPSPNQAPNSPDREPSTQTPNGSGQPSPRRTKHLRWDLPPGPPFLNKLHRLSPGRTSGAL
ncbi:hypothetical protein B0J17DRAFT_724824 [Rhizoctonia solani]|nr:hypothetical protein B0J17DRAFT_724824 [Rhizoctonia solani]